MFRVKLQCSHSHKMRISDKPTFFWIYGFEDLGQLSRGGWWCVQGDQTASYIFCSEDAFFFIVVGVVCYGEQGKSFEDLIFLVGGDVVFFGEF
jgi:hypothetical protein